MRIKDKKDITTSFSELSEIVPGGFYWFDTKHQLRGANSFILKIAGMKLENILGKTPIEMHPEEMGKEIVLHHKKVLQTGEKVFCEERIINPKTQQIIFFDVVLSPLYDENQNIFGVCGISTDITKRKNLELELRSKKNQLEKRLAFQKHYIKSYGYDYISALKLISDSVENIEARLMQLDIPQTVRSDLNDEFYQVNESLSEIYTLYQKINTAVLQQDERAKIVTVESTLEEIIKNEVGLANTFISSDLKTKVTYQIESLARQKLLIDYAKLRHIIRTFLANFTNSVNAQNSHDINLTVTAKAGLRSNTLYVTFSFDGGTPFLEFEGDTIRAEHLLNHSLNHIPGSKHSLAYELALAKSHIELLCDGEELNDAILDQQQLSFTLPFKKVYYEDRAPKLTAIINEVSD